MQHTYTPTRTSNITIPIHTIQQPYTHTPHIPILNNPSTHSRTNTSIHLHTTPKPKNPRPPTQILLKLTYTLKTHTYTDLHPTDTHQTIRTNQTSTHSYALKSTTTYISIYITT